MSPNHSLENRNRFNVYRFLEVTCPWLEISPEVEKRLKEIRAEIFKFINSKAKEKLGREFINEERIILNNQFASFKVLSTFASQARMLLRESGVLEPEDRWYFEDFYKDLERLIHENIEDFLESAVASPLYDIKSAFRTLYQGILVDNLEKDALAQTMYMYLCEKEKLRPVSIAIGESAILDDEKEVILREVATLPALAEVLNAARIDEYNEVIERYKNTMENFEGSSNFFMMVLSMAYVYLYGEYVRKKHNFMHGLSSQMKLVKNGEMPLQLCTMPSGFDARTMHASMREIESEIESFKGANFDEVAALCYKIQSQVKAFADFIDKKNAKESNHKLN